MFLLSTVSFAKGDRLGCVLLPPPPKGGGYFVKYITDDLDIVKQTRTLYARAKMVVRKFSSASLNIKLMLFRAYCCPIYGCQLWCSVYQYFFNKLRVAYNDAFRQLLQEARWCSALSLFAFNGASSCYDGDSVCVAVGSGSVSS